MRPRVLLIAAAIVVAAALVLFLTHALTTDAPRSDGTRASTPSTTQTTASTSSTTLVAPPPTAPATKAPPPPTVASSAPPPAAPAPLDLATAERTVDTQLQLLREGRDDEFRATFLPAVRIDERGIAACKKRIEQVPVRPDWEMVEQDVDEDGHPVKRVSMFGKAMTGFHQVDGKWLADGMWCVPIGLP